MDLKDLLSIIEVLLKIIFQIILLYRYDYGEESGIPDPLINIC